VGGGHHPHSDAPRLLLSVRRDRLVRKADARLAALHTLTADFWLGAVRDAIHRHGCPEIFNTGQVASSPAANSRVYSKRTTSGSAWTARGCGVPGARTEKPVALRPAFHTQTGKTWNSWNSWVR